MTDPQHFYQDEYVTLYNGDAKRIAPQLEQQITIVITDPPYGINYKPKDFDKIAGDQTTDLAQWCIEWWHPKPLIMFGANHYAPLLPESGKWSCWDKRVHPNADRMPGSPFELIWQNGVDTPGKMHRIQHGGAINADGRTLPRVHPTQKPVSLMRSIITDLQLDKDAIILDPFAGSGTTLRAAKDLGHKCIGIELDVQYCQSASERLAQEVLPI